MKACTSINVFFDSEFQASVQEQMRRAADGGFRHVDMNFWDWSHSEKSPFKQPDWRRWVEGIGAAARRMGLTFTQAHAHVYNFYAYEPENPHEEQIRRSIEGAGMLGIPWVVLHPSQRPDWEEADSLDRMIEENAAYFRGLAAYAQQFGVGLALENMSFAGSLRRSACPTWALAGIQGTPISLGRISPHPCANWADGCMRCTLRTTTERLMSICPPSSAA